MYRLDSPLPARQLARAAQAVPDVRGLPVRRAVYALHQAGFRVTLVSSAASQGPARASGVAGAAVRVPGGVPGVAGAAAGTVPAAGTLAAAGSTIRLARAP